MMTNFTFTFSLRLAAQNDETYTYTLHPHGKKFDYNLLSFTCFVYLLTKLLLTLLLPKQKATNGVWSPLHGLLAQF